MINKERWNKLREGHSSKVKERVKYFYIHEGSGNGDLLYNTAREIIDRDDHDCWSDDAFDAIFHCLKIGVRWPNYMIPHIPAATGPGDRQYDMTQDPWILAYCLAVHLGRYHYIRKYKPSCKLFNIPDKWAWRRALLGKPNLWWLWRLFPHTLLNKIRYTWKGKERGLFQDFVYVFYGYMDQAYLHIKALRKAY